MDSLIRSAPFSHHSSAASSCRSHHPVRQTTPPISLCLHRAKTRHRTLPLRCSLASYNHQTLSSSVAAPSEESILLHLTASSPHTPATAMRSADSDAMGLLLKERIVFLGSSIDDFVADSIISQLLLLDAQDSTKDIRLFINSSGGSLRCFNLALAISTHLYQNIDFRECTYDNLKDNQKKRGLIRYGSVNSSCSVERGDPTKKRRVDRSRKMAEAKERSSTPTIPSEMKSILKRCENLEKEVRSLKLNLTFMNRKDSEQTKQIKELQKQNKELVEEKERLLEEIERIIAETGKM